MQRITVCYWKRQRPEAYGSLDEGDPCFIFFHKSDAHVYGLPALEYPTHVKVPHDDGDDDDDDDDDDD